MKLGNQSSNTMPPTTPPDACVSASPRSDRKRRRTSRLARPLQTTPIPAQLTDGRLLVVTDCSGIESPIQALHGLGVIYTHAAACEQSKSLQKFIVCNYGPHVLYANVFERDDDAFVNLLGEAGRVDVYVNGPPCQSFSQAGRSEGDTSFFDKACATIDKMLPKVFLLENVDGLVGRHTDKLADIITKLNVSRVYNVYAKMLNSAKVGGVPQNRNRIYIVGIAKKLDDGSFEWPHAYPHGGLDCVLDPRDDAYIIVPPPPSQKNSEE